MARKFIHLLVTKDPKKDYFVIERLNKYIGMWKRCPGYFKLEDNGIDKYSTSYLPFHKWFEIKYKGTTGKLEEQKTILEFATKHPHFWKIKLQFKDNIDTIIWKLQEIEILRNDAPGSIHIASWLRNQSEDTQCIFDDLIYDFNWQRIPVYPEDTIRNLLSKLEADGQKVYSDWYAILSGENHYEQEIISPKKLD